MLDVKYSGIQIVYYGAWCALLGYASVFLLDRGFSNSIRMIIVFNSLEKEEIVK